MRNAVTCKDITAQLLYSEIRPNDTVLSAKHCLRTLCSVTNYHRECPARITECRLFFGRTASTRHTLPVIPISRQA